MIPPNAYERKKDPEGVRSAIVDAAMDLLAERGLARLTVEAVAKAAGVTKGGLFHHFPSKDALIDGVLDAMMAFVERSVETAMANDPDPQGRFTRACLRMVFDSPRIRETLSSQALCLAVLADPKLQDRWASWSESMVRRHADTDGTVSCAIVRLASDGIWLSTLRCAEERPQVDPAVHAALVAMTRASP